MGTRRSRRSAMTARFARRFCGPCLRASHALSVVGCRLSATFRAALSVEPCNLRGTLSKRRFAACCRLLTAVALSRAQYAAPAALTTDHRQRGEAADNAREARQL